jgi:hypothetical protein
VGAFLEIVMCSKADKKKMIDEDKGFFFRRANFIVSCIATGLTIAVLTVALIASFITTKLQATTNLKNHNKLVMICENRVEKVDEAIATLEEKTDGVYEVQFNLERICNELGIKYIRKEKR